MHMRHGDPNLIRHPIAQELLQAAIPVRLAYIALDGTPRVVPMQFHWTGEEVVVNSWPDDLKVTAIQAHPQVTLTLDTAEPPFRVLQIRGTAAITIMDGQSPEMAAAAKRYLGEDAGQAWLDGAARLSPQTARIAIRPAWVDVLDFETRFPSGLERRMAGARA